MDIRRIIRCSSCGRKLGIYCGGDLKLEIKCYRCKKICVYKFSLEEEFWIYYSPPDKGTLKDGSTRDAGETNSIYDTGFLVRLFVCRESEYAVVPYLFVSGERQGGFMQTKTQTKGTF